MSVWLKNENLILRSPEPEDLELLYSMENDTTLWNVGNATLPYSRYTLRLYLEQSKQDLFTERQARFVITLANGEAAGMIDLADFDPQNNRAEVCIGQLDAFIPAWNSESLKLFEKNGFTKSALLHQWQRTEQGYNNVFLVQKLAEQQNFSGKE